ncbi:Bug family tripartite tricarboxylate transporter substrate binding protein [Achromobacter insolitus]|nr:tripartite tricarboxylate transporter substrate binding protein [Achromobacter insolitus]
MTSISFFHGSRLTMTSTPVSRRQFIRVAAALGAAAAAPFSSGSWAQAPVYPARPIRYVCPYPPGGTNDLVSRIISRQLSEKLGVSVVVENRGGAGGTLGTSAVGRAEPDGYTLLNASSGNLTSAPQIIGATYDPLQDFIPVGFLGHVRFVFAVHPSLPVNTLGELIAYARAHPGQINYGTAGNGTGGHIAGEYLKLRTGIDIVHVPYRGSAPALTDAIAGRVHLVLDPLAAQYVRSGELKGLAFSGATVSPDLPGVPSIDAAGIQDWKATNFFLAALPAGTPAPIVNALSDAFLEIGRKPEVIAQLKALGVEIQANDRAATLDLLRSEIDVNNQVIATAKLATAQTTASR